MQTTEQKDKPTKKERKKWSTPRDSMMTFHTTKDQREIPKRGKTDEL